MGSIVPNMGNYPDTPERPRGVAEALFSNVQRRVLTVLFTNPDRSFFGGELIRLAASGSGAVQRELQRLESAGLVTVQQVGRQKHYRANAAAPVFAELRSLMVKTSGIADPIRSALAPRLYEIRMAFVYGSIAKGDDKATSDVDLMVVSDTLAYGELFALLEPAAVTLARSINPTLYSASELRARRSEGNSFVNRVLEQSKIWVIGGEGDLAT